MGCDPEAAQRCPWASDLASPQASGSSSVKWGWDSIVPLRRGEDAERRGG